MRNQRITGQPLKGGRLNTKASQTITETVSIAGAGGDEFGLGHSGEWHEVTISHTGQATFGIEDMRVLGRKLAQAVGLAAV